MRPCQPQMAVLQLQHLVHCSIFGKVLASLGHASDIVVHIPNSFFHYLCKSGVAPACPRCNGIRNPLTSHFPLSQLLVWTSGPLPSHTPARCTNDYLFSRALEGIATGPLPAQKLPFWCMCGIEPLDVIGFAP